MTSYCNSYNGEVLLLLHHFLGVYLYFGAFLFNNVYHLITILIVLIHWIINKHCEITTITNKLCGYKQGKKFQDFFQKLNMYKIHKHIHYIYITFLIVYDLCKINYL